MSEYPILGPWYHGQIKSGPREGGVYFRKIQKPEGSLVFCVVSEKGLWTDNYTPSEANRDIVSTRTSEGRLIPVILQEGADETYARAFINTQKMKSKTSNEYNRQTRLL